MVPLNLLNHPILAKNLSIHCEKVAEDFNQG
jgi:hypothetical protein